MKINPGLFSNSFFISLDAGLYTRTLIRHDMFYREQIEKKK